MSQSEILIDLPEGGAPYLREYFGWWLIEPKAGSLLAQSARNMDVSGHIAQQKAARAETVTQSVRRGYSYEVTDGVAMVSVSGSLMKHESSMDESTSTVMLRNTARAMKRDPNVRASIWVIDSPGGTVAGAYDLADDVAALARVKPTYAYIQDLGASAAYLQASQTHSISANRNALVGSIGTYGVVYDYSEMFANEGVKAIVISSGGLKGAGVPGTKITDEMIATWQKEIDALNAQFIDAVSNGRNMARERVEKLADGTVHIAAEAKKLGLVDRVESLDQLFTRVAREVRADAGSGARAESIVAVSGELEAISADRPLASMTITQGDRTISFMASNADDVLKLAQAGEQSINEKPETSPQSGESQTNDAGGRSDGDTSTAAEAAEVETAMSQGNTAGSLTPPAAPAVAERKSASMQELIAACPGAPSDFLVEQAKQGATIQESKDAFLQFQSAQIRARDEELKQLKAGQASDDGAAAPIKAPGAKVVEGDRRTIAASSSRVGGDVIEQFNEAVGEQMKLPGYSDRKKAVSAVVRKDPELHQAYLEATNPSRKAQELIRDKFATA